MIEVKEKKTLLAIADGSSRSELFAGLATAYTNRPGKPFLVWFRLADGQTTPYSSEPTRDTIITARIIAMSYDDKGGNDRFNIVCETYSDDLSAPRQKFEAFYNTSKRSGTLSPIANF